PCASVNNRRWSAESVDALVWIARRASSNPGCLAKASTMLAELKLWMSPGRTVTAATNQVSRGMYEAALKPEPKMIGASANPDPTRINRRSAAPPARKRGRRERDAAGDTTSGVVASAATGVPLAKAAAGLKEAPQDRQLVLVASFCAPQVEHCIACL